MVQDHFLEKRVFDPIFDPLLVPKRPIFKAFWDFPWPKTRHHGLKMAPKHLFEHPKWSRNNFGKKNFFSPWGPWWTHRWPPLCVGRPALRLHQVTTGTGVYVSRWAILRLGNHKKWGVAGGLGALGIRF